MPGLRSHLTTARSTVALASAGFLWLPPGALGAQPVPTPPPTPAGPDADATEVTALVGVQRFHFERAGTAPEVEVRAEKRVGPGLLLGGSLAGSWMDHERHDGTVQRNTADRWGVLVFLTGLARIEAPGSVSPWVEAGAGFFANSNYDVLVDGAGLAGHVGTGLSADVAEGWRIHLGYRLRRLGIEVGGTTHTFSVGVTLPAGPFGAPDFQPPDRLEGC